MESGRVMGAEMGIGTKAAREQKTGEYVVNGLRATRERTSNLVEELQNFRLRLMGNESAPARPDAPADISAAPDGLIGEVQIVREQIEDQLRILAREIETLNSVI